MTRADLEALASDFTCAICQREVSNRFCCSPRDVEDPPICRFCETVTGYAWNGGTRSRTRPTGGTHWDKRMALRIGALADAISEEANRQHWSAKYGRA